ncbi:dihydroorotase [Acetobacter nitrogenifigens DSM 23921 = NBRC 105050]|uniref:Allantoinase n=1 Tax=Acetobacter nitrogenifigens DSM 23921 = NBRC 105050 TaxID=1120919 RepID=A0A511X7Y9_9PROT|nr:dihydroorotase family protein [Acetobacter nitrogenifigens]GBQ89100.1 dihydroorotase [Acetobacter nitrogenifigens DSM 23921 = NBRC 105050]GEN59060.1 allantoinase [Acetobacter nitrogenifigens DSM 23921 = NBRC 105050]
MHDLLLKGAVVTTRTVSPDAWIVIDDGRISQIGHGAGPAAREVQDYGDALILPGAIDPQVHSRSQKGQEDFIWSTRAAAAGGVTTIADMPYDDGFLVSTAENLRQKAREAGDQARIDFALWGTIAPDDGPSHIPAMAEAGACGFKFSTFGTDPVRFPRIPPDLLASCFEAVTKTGLIAGVHNEDDEMVRSRIAAVTRTGVTDWRAHGMSRPPLAETLAMAQIYETAAATGCSAHVVHCSVARGYALCEAYRQQGFDTTVEACIHYLILDEEHDVARLGGRAKINPPIRPRAEVEGLWAHLAAGNVTVVSTDHVSWSLSRKSDPEMLKNASGAPGLEALYPLLLTELARRGLSLSHAARLLAENPARLFRISAQKGGLAPGRDADITIARREKWIYDATQSRHSIAGWSAYDGRALDWRIAATWLRGKLVFDGQDVLAEPGTGRFVCPPSSGTPS